MKVRLSLAGFPGGVVGGSIAAVMVVGLVGGGGAVYLHNDAATSTTATTASASASPSPVIGGLDPSPSMTVSPTPTAKATTTATVSAAPTATVAATATATPKPTPTPAPTDLDTPTAAPTAYPSLGPSGAPPPTATFSMVQLPSITSTEATYSGSVTIPAHTTDVEGSIEASGPGMCIDETLTVGVNSGPTGNGRVVADGWIQPGQTSVPISVSVTNPVNTPCSWTMTIYTTVVS